jgi:methylated-DNA-[protein]-cysteine S-methyltransferase
MQKTIKYTVFETKWGYFGLAGTENGLWQTCLPGLEPENIKCRFLKSLPHLDRESSIEVKVSGVEFDKTFFKTAQEQITSYFEGARVDFRNIPIVLNGFSDFHHLVLTVCRDIEFGRTVSYSALAKKAGRPAAARAVGTALAGNPLPLIIPCHRIVRSDGKIGDFSAPGGRDLKAKLLKHENCALM